MFFPIILLVTSSTAWLMMVSVAVNDPGFAVEQDYYKKGTRFNEVIAQRGQNERLNWRVQTKSVSLTPAGRAKLILTIKDDSSQELADVTVSAEAFANARAAEIRDLIFTKNEEGDFEVEFERARPGLWEFRLIVVAGQTFTKVLRVEFDERIGGA